MTNLTFIEYAVSSDMTSISLGDVFKDNICSPYNLSVSAYSTLGGATSTHIPNIGLEADADSSKLRTLKNMCK